MAITNSYLTSTKNLESIINSVINAKAPERFTNKFLEDLGYKSSNDNGLTLLSVVSPFSLYKNQFSNHRSRYTYSDTIHLLHPLHLVGGFELFRDTFLFGVFFYQPRKEGLCFFLYIGEVGM